MAQAAGLATPLRAAASTGYLTAMIELMRSNDAVLISFAEALLNEAGLGHAVLDRNMSVMEGSIGILPRRMLVPRDEHERARRILMEAGLGSELS